MTTHTPREQSNLLTVPEAAEVLRWSVRTVNAYIAEGRIGIVRIGRASIRIERSEIDRIIREGRTSREGGQ